MKKKRKSRKTKAVRLTVKDNRDLWIFIWYLFSYYLLFSVFVTFSGILKIKKKKICWWEWFWTWKKTIQKKYKYPNWNHLWHNSKVIKIYVDSSQIITSLPKKTNRPEIHLCVRIYRNNDNNLLSVVWINSGVLF